MEKIIYALGRGPSLSPEGFPGRLIAALGPGLMRSGVLKLSLAVNDEDVSAASRLRISHHDPAIEAVACVWVHTADDRRDLEAVLREHTTIIAGYLVCESEPLRNPDPVQDGKRTPGMLQVAFLRRPGNMDRDEWYSIWRNDHTAVAIETQSTFAYRQNLVVRPLTADAPEYAAIVEESFPAEAMTSQHAFYAAEGDDGKLHRHLQRMWESSKRFIDLSAIDVLPMSEYVWGTAAAKTGANSTCPHRHSGTGL